MRVDILEPLQTYLSDEVVQAAVRTLRKRDSDKRVGISAAADWVVQDEYLDAWLAAQEIYVAWHRQLREVWRKVWLDSPNWASSGLTALSTANIISEGWDLPTMQKSWDEEWTGGVFRDKTGALVGLYVFASLERLYLIVSAPHILKLPDTWEIGDDDGEQESVDIAEWGNHFIDCSDLRKAADDALAFMAAS